MTVTVIRRGSVRPSRFLIQRRRTVQDSRN